MTTCSYPDDLERDRSLENSQTGLPPWEDAHQLHGATKFPASRSGSSTSGSSSKSSRKSFDEKKASDGRSRSPVRLPAQSDPERERSSRVAGQGREGWNKHGDDDTSACSDDSSDTQDLEAGPTPDGPFSSAKERNSNVITWNGPDAPCNPKNWSIKRKWSTTIIVGAFTFLSPVASSMMAPALNTIAEDFSVSGDVEVQLMLSIFVLGYAFGPLFLGPLSEVFGRVVVLQWSNGFFAAFNLACGFSQNESQMISFRLLAGLGASAPLAIGGAVIGDCWRLHERGRALAIFSLMPLLGTAMGPLAGGFVAGNADWRWIFWSITIACAIMQFIGFVFLRESFAAVILRRKKLALARETGDQELVTEYEEAELPILWHMRRALYRPFRLLFTQPIVQFMAIYMAYVYGLIYLVMSTFPLLWSSPLYYGESIGIGGLNYVSLALGYCFGGQLCALFNDRICRRLQAKTPKCRAQSEYRLPLAIPASMILPVGLLLYGWTAETHQDWILPNMGAFLYALGSIVVFQCLQTYIVDAYTHYAASALAAVAVLRSLCGFGFPLFAPAMYESLGFGWGNSVLALVAIVVGIPAPVVLWKCGAALRARSRFCAGGVT